MRNKIPVFYLGILDRFLTLSRFCGDFKERYIERDNNGARCVRIANDETSTVATYLQGEKHALGYACVMVLSSIKTEGTLRGVDYNLPDFYDSEESIFEIVEELLAREHYGDYGEREREESHEV